MLCGLVLTVWLFNINGLDASFRNITLHVPIALFDPTDDIKNSDAVDQTNLKFTISPQYSHSKVFFSNHKYPYPYDEFNSLTPQLMGPDLINYLQQQQQNQTLPVYPVSNTQLVTKSDLQQFSQYRPNNYILELVNPSFIDKPPNITNLFMYTHLLVHECASLRCINNNCNLIQTNDTSLKEQCHNRTVNLMIKRMHIHQQRLFYGLRFNKSLTGYLTTNQERLEQTQQTQLQIEQKYSQVKNQLTDVTTQYSELTTKLYNHFKDSLNLTSKPDNYIYLIDSYQRYHDNQKAICTATIQNLTHVLCDNIQDLTMAYCNKQYTCIPTNEMHKYTSQPVNQPQIQCSSIQQELTTCRLKNQNYLRDILNITIYYEKLINITDQYFEHITTLHTKPTIAAADCKTEYMQNNIRSLMSDLQICEQKKTEKYLHSMNEENTSIDYTYFQNILPISRKNVTNSFKTIFNICSTRISHILTATDNFTHLISSLYNELKNVTNMLTSISNTFMTSHQKQSAVQFRIHNCSIMHNGYTILKNEKIVKNLSSECKCCQRLRSLYISYKLIAYQFVNCLHRSDQLQSTARNCTNDTTQQLLVENERSILKFFTVDDIVNPNDSTSEEYHILAQHLSYILQQSIAEYLSTKMTPTPQLNPQAPPNDWENLLNELMQLFQSNESTIKPTSPFDQTTPRTLKICSLVIFIVVLVRFLYKCLQVSSFFEWCFRRRKQNTDKYTFDAGDHSSYHESTPLPTFIRGYDIDHNDENIPLQPLKLSSTSSSLPSTSSVTAAADTSRTTVTELPPPPPPPPPHIKQELSNDQPLLKKLLGNRGDERKTRLANVQYSKTQVNSDKF